MFQPINSACSTEYRAAHDSGTRDKKQIRFIVIHDTEGPTAESAASWFANPGSEGSANLVVDDDVCYRTLNDNEIPWAAPGKNNDGFHIELAGHAHFTRSDWLKHSLELKRAAYKAAQRAVMYGIPLKKRGWLGVRLGRPGFCGHKDVSYAYPWLAKQAGFHTDPGDGFPWDVFMTFVNAYANRIRNSA